jgi:hypothetical protein
MILNLITTFSLCSLFVLAILFNDDKVSLINFVLIGAILSMMMIISAQASVIISLHNYIKNGKKVDFS